MNIKTFGAIAALAGSLVTGIGSFLPVGAVPFGSDTVYRTQENGRNYVYVSATASAPVELQSNGIATSPRQASACGVIRLSAPAAGWPAGSITVAGRTGAGATVNPSTLPTQLVPACNSQTGQLAEARTADFKDAVGNVYLVGFTPSLAVSIGTPRLTTRRATANACGFARIVESTTTPFSTFTISGTTYTYSALPVATDNLGPICRNGAAYRPVNWTP